MPNPGQLYADLSPLYDRFCRDINYLQQCEYAQRAYKLFGQSGGTDYFDLACGTGQHLTIMAAAGFSVTGLDNSQAMLQQAALRCPNAKLVEADLAAFDYQATFDLISCFLYSLHYSQPYHRLHQVLQRAYAALKPGGILIFDMVDKNGILNNSALTTHMTEIMADGTTQNFEFSSQWQYSGHGDVMELWLRIKRQISHHTELWQDTHTMTALTIQQTQQTLQQIGFDVYVMTRDYERLVPWDGETFNVIIIAVKVDTIANG